jgi:hypothetical protein
MDLTTKHDKGTNSLVVNVVLSLVDDKDTSQRRVVTTRDVMRMVAEKSKKYKLAKVLEEPPAKEITNFQGKTRQSGKWIFELADKQAPTPAKTSTPRITKTKKSTTK